MFDTCGAALSRWQGSHFEVGLGTNKLWRNDVLIECNLTERCWSLYSFIVLLKFCIYPPFVIRFGKTPRRPRKTRNVFQVPGSMINAYQLSASWNHALFLSLTCNMETEAVQITRTISHNTSFEDSETGGDEALGEYLIKIWRERRQDRQQWLGKG